MVTEEESIIDVYRKEPHEFKEWACKQVGAVREDRKPRHWYPDGYIHELNTCIVAKQTFNVGKKDYGKANLFLSEYEHIIIIAFSFPDKYIKLVHGDTQREIMLVTVENLMNKNYVSKLIREIKIANNPRKLGDIFKIKN